MKKLFITLFFIFFVLVGFAQNEIDAKTVRARGYFIWDNDYLRTAATADSIMGFVNGSDTATMIPIPSGGGGTPASPANSVQYNSAGSFGGDASFVWDDMVGRLNLGSPVGANGAILFTATDGDNGTVTISTNDYLTFNGFVRLVHAGDFYMTGDIELTGNLNVSEDADIGNALGVGGTATIEDDLVVEENITVGQNSVGKTDMFFYNLPIDTRDSVLYISNDTVYRGAFSGGGGSPGGSDTEVQFNDGGSFGGDASFVWDKTNNYLGIGTTPSYSLDADGIINSNGSYYINDNEIITNAFPYTTYGFGGQNGARLGGSQDSYIINDVTNDHAWKAGNYTFMEYDQSDADLFLNTGVRFGIETTSPNWDLHVGGDVGIEDLPLLNSDTVLVMSNDSIGYAIGASGGVTINDNTNNNLLTASGTANTINGEDELTYNSGNLELSFDGGGASLFEIKSYVSGSPSSGMATYGYNGASAASYAAVQNNDQLGYWLFGGSESASSTHFGVEMYAYATETWTSATHGSKLEFKVAYDNGAGSGDPQAHITVQDSVTTITHILELTGLGSAPGSPEEGMIYYNNTSHHLYVYNGTSWVQLDN